MSRSSRLSVTLTTAERSALRRRARAHRTSMAAFMRAAALGDFSGSKSRIADEWWDTLPPARRAQVHGWLNRGADRSREWPNQLVLVGEDETQA